MDIQVGCVGISLPFLFLWGKKERTAIASPFRRHFQFQVVEKIDECLGSIGLEANLSKQLEEKTCHYYLEPQGQPFIKGCFNGMIPNLYIENGCCTKHPFIKWLALGFQGRQNLASPPGSQRFFKKPFESTQGGERFEWVFLGGWANQSLAKTMNPEIWIC